MKQIDLFDNDKETIDKFLDMKIEEIFAHRFASYSKYIIQERALPDIKDGLKPVQRRIIYAMYKEGNLSDKQYRKSAKTVGNVIGNYHPHGDSSVYDAMVRLSQSWKMQELLVDMHGNNGSVDGDSPAAMRYTEAKLSKYSEYIMKDLELGTVDMVPNFDDTQLEPVTMPTRLPNLLINGSSGISAGYATDIPPHNPLEIIEAVRLVNQKPNTTLESLLSIVKGPDFPTGGIIQGKDEIKRAYQTGKGKISIKSKIKIEGQIIIIQELPYDVNKSTLLQKIDLIRINNKIDGIKEILDQSAEQFIEIEIHCKKDASAQMIMQYLLKNTDLQKTYNFNMIAINNNKPEQVGLLTILNAFLEHRRKVILRRSEFKLEKTKVRLHIVKGLREAFLNLDPILITIKKSDNKKNAKENIEKQFGFTEVQSEAIVMMQLYRLTSIDIKILNDEFDQLNKAIIDLSEIIEDPKRLQNVIELELKDLLQLFKGKRMSLIEDKVEKIDLNRIDFIKKETIIFGASKNGYLKRSSQRSYLSTPDPVAYLEGDSVQTVIKTTTTMNLYIFMSDGTYIKIPAFDIIDSKWKEMGKHISNLCKVNDGAKVVRVVEEEQLNGKYIVQISDLGYYTKVLFDEYKIEREKSKVKGQALKSGDQINTVLIVNNFDKIGVVTKAGFGAVRSVSEMEEYQIKRVGKKLGKLKKDDLIQVAEVIVENLIVITDKGGYAKFKINKFPETDKMIKLYENIKSNLHKPIMIIDGHTLDYMLNNDRNNLVKLTGMQAIEIGDKLKLIHRNLEIKSIDEQLNI